MLYQCAIFTASPPPDIEAFKVQSQHLRHCRAATILLTTNVKIRLCATPVLLDTCTSTAKAGRWSDCQLIVTIVKVLLLVVCRYGAE